MTALVDEDLLIAPIGLDALVIGTIEADPGIFQWTDLSPDYGKLEDAVEFCFGPEIVNGGNPFSEAAPLPPGVHLKFQLPKALSHGSQDGPDGKLRFPRLPNRWLIQRLAPTAGAYAAWLVTDAPAGGQGGLAWPDWPRQAGAPLTVRRLGTSDPLSAFPAATEAKAMANLSVIGPGDVFFGANYRASGAILGFHDPLKDDQAAPARLAPQKLGYLVTGWYSSLLDDPVQQIMRTGLSAAGLNPDPLPDAQARAALLSALGEEARAQFTKGVQDWYSERNWTLPRGAGTRLPWCLMCHGLMRGIDWRGADIDHMRGPARPSQPAGVAQVAEEVFPVIPSAAPKHEVALGETIAEAMAALLKSGPVEQDVLTALQQDLLGQPVTIERLLSELHARRFDGHDGGTHYVLKSAERAADPLTGLPPPESRRLRPPADLTRLLAELQAQQADCDRLSRTRESLRQLIYGIWRLRAARRVQDAQPAETADAGPLHDQLVALGKELETLDTDLDTARRACRGLHDPEAGPEASKARLDIALRAHLQPDGRPQFRVAPQAGPPFHGPSEPAIALSGAAARPRNLTAAPDGRCRGPAEVTTELKLVGLGGREVTVTGAKLVAELFGATGPATKLDPRNAAFLEEACLLDPAHTAQIAGAPTRPEGDLKKDVAGQQAALGPGTGARDWQGDPWRPLALVWEVEWRGDTPPSSGGASPPEADIAALWQIDAQGEFARNDPGVAPATQPPQTVAGVSILAEAVGEQLAEGLKAIAPSHPLIDHIRNRRAQVQRMAGLLPALTGRRRGYELPPLDYDAWMTSGFQLDPILDGLEAGLRPFGPAPVGEDAPFQPVRTGRMRLHRLSVVDSFGRTRKLLGDGAEIGADRLEFRPAHGVAGDDVASEPLQIRLKPRLAHPARLRFDWLETDGAGPVHGFVVANWLDKGLMIYTADGGNLGLLQRRLGSQGAATGFFWVPAPGTASAATAAQPQIDHLPLRHFVDWALDLGNDEAEHLFALFGEAVAAADDRQPEADAAVATLMGRPFALAGASVSLEPRGLPAHRPTLKAETGTLEAMIDTGGGEAVGWPLRLGGKEIRSDGMIGAFAADPTAPTGYAARFLPSSGRDFDGTGFGRQELQVNARDRLELLLLLDPQAKLHLTTGVLPRCAVELPEEDAEGRLKVRDAFFQTAPVLGFAAVPELPIPSSDYGEWSWAYRPDVTSWQMNPDLVRAAERGGFAPGWPHLSEGWLKLRVTSIRGLGLWTRDRLPSDGEGVPVVPAGRSVVLQWSVQGASALRLVRLGADQSETPVPGGDALDPAGELDVKITETATFRLIASNDEDSAMRELTIATGGMSP